MDKRINIRSWSLSCGLLVFLCLVGAWVHSSVKAKYRQVLVAKAELLRITEKIDKSLRYNELTHWQREDWEIGTFFHTPEAIQACEYISRKEISALHEWVQSDGDVNLSGDYGVTLLFWAMLDRNMRAYQYLLNHGANVDSVLTENIELKNGRFFLKEDTVMFAAIALFDCDFMLVAIPYSANPDHRDMWGHNLLARLVHGSNLFNVEPFVLSALIRAGVAADVRTGEYGLVSTQTLLLYKRIAQCHAMLLAGADPTFESTGGDSVVSYVRKDIKAQKEITRTPPYIRLVTWLVRKGYLESEYRELLRISVASETKALTMEKGTVENSSVAKDISG